MTIDPQDGSSGNDIRHSDAADTHDAALDALLRRTDRGAPVSRMSALEARIMSQATFPLAFRRRSTRTSTADMLAGWVRVAIPLAAAAAIFAVVSLARLDVGSLADAELRESDPAALMSALESGGSTGLAHHLIANDTDASAAGSESR